MRRPLRGVEARERRVSSSPALAGSIRRDMPETPPIERTFFRPADDGTTVFFPWGLAHRGYVLRSEADRRQASRASSLLIGATVGIGAWAAQALQPLVVASDGVGPGEILRALLWPGAALALAFLGYFLWASRFVEGLAASGLQISREERLREAAQRVAPWQVAAAGVGVAGAGGLLIWLEPGAWWLGLLGLATGIGIVVWASLLHRAASRSAPLDPRRGVR
jgi:hypothetical protein